MGSDRVLSRVLAALAAVVAVAALAGVPPAAAAAAPAPVPSTPAEPAPLPVDDGALVPPGENSGAFATAGRWPSPALTYGFLNTTPDLGRDATIAAFRQAFDVWEAAAGLTFTEVPDCAATACSAADVRIRFDDPFTVCTAAFLGCAFYPGQGALAGDVFVNDGYTWSDQEGYDPGTGTYDLVELAMHEIGHAVGMRHTDPSGLCLADPTDPVMCAFINRVTRDLHADDLAGVRALYDDGPPVNDAFVDATLLVGAEGTLAGSLSAATAETADPVCGGPQPAGGLASTNAGASDVQGQDADVCGLATAWWRFVAPATGRFVVQARSLGAGQLGASVFEGPALGALRSVRDRVLGGSVDRLAFVAEAGRTYHLALWSSTFDTGSFEVAWAHQAGVVQRFTDVSVEHPAFDDIEGAAARGLVNGYDDRTFRPSAPVSRQSMAAFLFRASGEPAPTGCQPTFRDVSPSHPFFREICWAVRSGVTEGYADGTFRPVAPVTRQAAARLLRRATGALPVTGCELPWDVSPAHPFYGDVCWMASVGITTAAEFRPAAPVSRQAAAAFLQRLDEQT